MTRILIASIALAVVAAACSSDDAGSSDPQELPPVNSQDATQPSSDDPIPVEPDGGIGDGAGPPGADLISPALAAEVEAAVLDLAARLGDDAFSETLVAHELTWPDGSLGCPEPGKSYSQALVPGYRIEIRSADTVYTYHGAEGQAPFLCEAGTSSD